MTRTGPGEVWRRPIDVVFVLAGSAVLAVSAGYAMGSPLTWERELFQTLNGLPPRLELLAWPVQQLGMALAIPVGALLLVRLSRSWRTPVTLMGLSLTLGWGAANLLRNYVERGRPPSFLDGVRLGYDVPDAGPAFPSGHAIVVWTLIVVLAPYVRPSAVAIMCVLAVVVMACRAFVGAHMPLDLIGGAGYGVSIGGLSNLLGGITPASRVELKVGHG